MGKYVILVVKIGLIFLELNSIILRKNVREMHPVKLPAVYI